MTHFWRIFMVSMFFSNLFSFFAGSILGYRQAFKELGFAYLLKGWRS